MTAGGRAQSIAVQRIIIICLYCVPTAQVAGRVYIQCNNIRYVYKNKGWMDGFALRSKWIDANRLERDFLKIFRERLSRYTRENKKKH